MRDLVTRAWRDGWVVFVLGSAITIVLIWWVPSFSPPLVTSDKPHTLYFLSSLAQSLAAVLALVFTISLVVAQLSSRYSTRMLAEFFDPLTIGYILVFIVAVVFPFGLLSQDQPVLAAVRASLTLGVLSLLLLIPYFLRFKDKLSPYSVLNKLEKNAARQLRLDAHKEPPEIATLDNFCMSAYVSRDYDTFDKGIRAISNLATQVSREYKDQTGKRMFYRLLDIGVITIEDPKAPIQVILALRDTATHALEERRTPAADWSIFPVTNIGLRAVQKGLENTAEQSVTSLDEIGISAIRHGVANSVSRVCSGLEIIGSGALEAKKSHVLQQCTSALSQLALENVKESSVSQALDASGQSAVQALSRIVALAVKESHYHASIVHPALITLWKVGADATKANLERTKSATAHGLLQIDPDKESLLLPTFRQCKESLLPDTPNGSLLSDLMAERVKALEQFRKTVEDVEQKNS